MFQRVTAVMIFLTMLSGCSKERIPDDSSIASAISKSDDYSKYEQEFLEASKKLLTDGECSLKDFEEMGGWMKSTTTYKDKPVYFTYCGGMSRSNRIYVNTSNGNVFK